MAGVVRLHSVAAFLGAFLFFSLELLCAKLLLPRFGGAAYVWTVSAAVFQGLLLGGYLFARAALPRLGGRFRAAHLSLLALCALWLPPALSGWDGPHPSWRLACALLVGAGPLFFVLGSATPVLQAAYSSAGSYSLFAASNLGALCALAAYPLLVEPLLPVPAQARAWTALFALFAALHLLMRPAASPPAPPETAASSREERLVWTLLSAGAAAALAAVTNLLSLDFSAVPLVWAVPLALYLLTFVAAFKDRPWYPRHESVLLAALFVLWLAAALALVLFAQGEGRWLLARRLWALNRLAYHLGGLFVLSLVVHRVLALSRPESARAPDFYAWVGLGGWAGASLVAAVLPVLARRWPWPQLDWAAAGALTLLALLRALRLARAQKRLEAGPSRGVVLALAFVGALGLFAVSRRSPASLGAAVASLRNFYGFHRVADDGGLRRLLHGGTVHGAQSLDAARAGEPLLYYHRDSPGGEAMAALGARARRVEVLGLGAGAAAAYARPGQSWTFRELDPDVVALARERFTYLSRLPSARVVLGDARLTLARSTAAADLIVVDVFAGGAVPVHLLTREALELYVSRLAPGGALAFHVTHRFLDLRGILAGLAAEAGLSGLAKESGRDEPPGAEKAHASWVVLAREPASLAALAREGWAPLSGFSRGRRVWTDDHAPLLSALTR